MDARKSSPKLGVVAVSAQILGWVQLAYVLFLVWAVTSEKSIDSFVGTVIFVGALAAPTLAWFGRTIQKKPSQNRSLWILLYTTAASCFITLEFFNPIGILYIPVFVMIIIALLKKADHHKVIEALIAIAVVGTVVTVGAFYQLSTINDGTINYTGVKLEAAKHAIVHIENVEGYAQDSQIPIEKLQVVKVAHGLGRYCSGTRTPADVGYYDVTVRQVWLYGTYSESIWDGCILEMDL